MLTLWNPPPFIVACSQTVVPDSETGEPVLFRNYDYDPRLFEATVYRSRWGSRRVMGTGDCLWGLVDGVNDRGLAVSLTFGGRREVGEGFGVPLVMRYCWRSCDDVAAGVAVLRRLPHQLSYNITLADRDGAVATVYVAPDRLARVTDRCEVTNHPEAVEWPEHAAWVESDERLEPTCGSCRRGATRSDAHGRGDDRPRRCWRDGGTRASRRSTPPPTGRSARRSPTSGRERHRS